MWIKHSLGYLSFFSYQTLDRLIKIVFCKLQWKFLFLGKKKYTTNRHIDLNSIRLIKRPYIKKSAATVQNNIFSVLTISEPFNLENWTYKQSALWQFHLHDFDYIHELSNNVQAMVSWITQVPFGTYLAWHAYPTSLRLCNWIWSYSENPDAFTDTQRQQILSSLYNQALFLEHHLEIDKGGNHLIENVKALITAGVFFSEERWLTKGDTILKQECEVQLFKDGGHFERSPMYHIIVMECLIAVKAAFNRINRPTEYVERSLSSMARWISRMSYRGELPQFQDSILYRSLSVGEILKYVGKEGLNEPPTRTDVTPSGYAVLEDRDTKIIVDIGDMSPKHHPGHAHNGYGHFVAYSHGEYVITDGGVFTYDNTPARTAFRGTASHNALMVNGTEHNELWGSFRSGRRGKIVQATATENEINCTFQDFKGNSIKRQLTYDHHVSVLTICDEVLSPKQAHIQSYLHLAHQVNVTKQENTDMFPNEIYICDTPKVRLIITFSLPESCRVQLIETDYAEEMGKKMSRPSFKIEGVVGSRQLITTIKYETIS